MNIEYTDYAQMKIAKRALSKNQVEDTLKNPDKIIGGGKGRKIAQKVMGKYLCGSFLKSMEIHIRLLRHITQSLKGTSDLYGNSIRSENRFDGY